MPAFSEVRRTPVYLQVANQLREAIFAGELKAKDELPSERDLATTFGASRASVREALRVLEAQGLIATTGPPTRAVIADEFAAHVSDGLSTLMKLGQVELDDLVELRGVLESAAVKGAAAKVSEGAALDDLRAAVAAGFEAGDSAEAFHEADVQFHIAIAELSGNSGIFLVMNALRSTMARYLKDALDASSDLGATTSALAKEHQRIQEAIEAGDGDEAARLLTSHVEDFYGASRDGDASA